MKNINFWIRNYFGFSETENRGFVILMFLMVALIFAPMIYTGLAITKNSESTTDQKKLDSLLATIEHVESFSKPVATSAYKKTYEKQARKEIMFFPFDPNKISVEDWEKLGVKKYIAQNIIKYRDKGGVFRKKKDLLKIYGFQEELYHQLENHIQLPDEFPKNNQEKKEHKPVHENSGTKYAKRNIESFDLNTADTSALKNIKGIGEKLSQRIIQYRDKLGGFVNLEQLKEVYGLEEDVINELKKFAYLKDAYLIRKININQAGVEELGKHPYIGYKLAKVIVNYRNEHNVFANEEDLKNVKVVTPEILQKLRPYLNFR